MWQHVVLEPDDDPESERVEFEQFKFKDYNIEIFSNGDGRFIVEASNDLQELVIGLAGTLEASKHLAQQWMLGRIGELLEAAGAEGVWIVRGAYRAMLAYSEATENVILPAAPLQLSPPHELIVLARFPAGDGREPGIEFIG